MKKSKKSMVILLIFLLLNGSVVLFYLNKTCISPDEPEKAPPPTIKYAEFPFTVVFELDGRKYNLDDTALCSYVGYTSHTVNTKDESHNRYPEGSIHECNKWKLEYKKSGEKIILHRISDTDYIEFRLGCSAAYLMGDKRNYLYDSYSEYYIEVFTYKDGIWTQSSISSDSLYEKYGLKILDFKIAPPIENTFGE